MKETAQNKDVLQWYPAFFAGLQIELAAERENLVFENEHQLSKKPMEIDILVIKKERDLPVKKNIGRIFKKYNLIEYKSPTDYLSIDDFYKVYGYACFYKSDTGKTDEICADELSITLVSLKYPRKLVGHLQQKRGYVIEKAEKGIYYIKGDYIPIQLIVTSRLSKEENLWLRNLTNRLSGTSEAKKLIEEYGRHKNENLYKAVMDVIVRANRERFQEVKSMCEALEELMKEEMDALREKCIEEGIQEGMQKGMQKGQQEGIRNGVAQSVLELLGTLGSISAELEEHIQQETNLEVLKAFLKKAASAQSMEEFEVYAARHLAKNL